MNRRINLRRWLYALVVLLVIIAALYLSGWVFRVAQAGSDILALYFFAWLVQFFFTPVVLRSCIPVVLKSRSPVVP